MAMFRALDGTKVGGGLWNPSAPVALANVSATLGVSKVCERCALITPAPTFAASLSAIPPPSTSSISMVEPARCGPGKRFLHWNGELLDWWLVMLVWRGGTLAYNIAAIWFISAVWLALSWLIAFATYSGMVAVMVLPVLNAAMFVIVVAVVAVSSLSANTLYILWEVGAYPCCPAVLHSCCTRMHLVYAAAMNVLRVG
jgi:hypothetical protein